MTSKKESLFSNHIIAGFMVLSIALVAFLTYINILSFFFTGTDTLTLIESSRIQSFEDVGRIFSEPMMSGTGFMDIARFYRPVQVLSYSLDYSIWKLDPFGYHLTDVIIHCLVSLAVLFVISSLTNGKKVVAWIGAFIFAVHPVFIENIPSIENRTDTLAVMFLLISFLLFIKYYSCFKHKKISLFSSVLFYLLAFGSKEVSVILLFLVISYSIIIPFSDKSSFKDKILHSFKITLPYFLVTVIYLLWRTHVLEGLGGYKGRATGISTLNEIVTIYFKGVIYPVNFLSLNSLFSPLPVVIKQILLLSVIFVFLISLFSYRRTIFRIINCDENVLFKLLKMLLAAVLILSIIGFLVYPLVSPYINQLLHDAYDGKGFENLTKAMGNRKNFSVEVYIKKVKDLVLSLSVISMVFSAVCLAGMHWRNEIKRVFISSDYGKPVVFFMVWFLLPLGIYVTMTTFPYWGIYVSVIPFCAIISIISVQSFQSAVNKIKKGSSPVIPEMAIFILAAGLMVSLLVNSPLVRKYGGWEESAEITLMFLNSLSEVVNDLPDDAVLHIDNFPKEISSYEPDTLHKILVIYLLKEYSIKSWLNLNHAPNNMKVIINSRSKPDNYPAKLVLEVKKIENKDVFINVKWQNSF